jgi:hypothetical protein
MGDGCKHKASWDGVGWCGMVQDGAGWCEMGAGCMMQDGCGMGVKASVVGLHIKAFMLSSIKPIATPALAPKTSCILFMLVRRTLTCSSVNESRYSLASDKAASKFNMAGPH